MSKENKIIFGIGFVFFAFFLGLVYKASKATLPQEDTTPVENSILVNTNSHQTKLIDAQITLVEFGDFQCPSCGQAQPVIKELLKTYEGKVNFVFRNFPLPAHRNAVPAAEAAEAAGEQGKFWEMYDKLYENQNKWSEKDNPLEIFEAFAKDLNLDIAKFNEAVKNQKFKDVIAADLADGEKARVNATPTFFVNGQRIVGLPSLEQFKTLIDQKL